MKVNTHGLKMTGIRKVSRETKELAAWGAGCYNLSLYYDINQGYLWTIVEGICDEDLGDGLYKIANLWDYFNMQEIADMVYYRLVERGIISSL